MTPTEYAASQLDAVHDATNDMGVKYCGKRWTQRECDMLFVATMNHANGQMLIAESKEARAEERASWTK